jgi:hypothetical protein
MTYSDRAWNSLSSDIFIYCLAFICWKIIWVQRTYPQLRNTENPHFFATFLFFSQIIIRIDVGYVRSGFEYFADGFANELAPTLNALAPGSSHWALLAPSVPFQKIHQYEGEKIDLPPKKREKNVKKWKNPPRFAICPCRLRFYHGSRLYFAWRVGSKCLFLKKFLDQGENH